MQLPLSLSVSDPTPNPQPTTTDTEGSVVRYRVGLNPVQQAIHDYVARMSGADVQAFVDAFRGDVTWGNLEPVFPKPGTTAHLLAGDGECYFTPNDLVEHAGLHADTVDKYLHNYIGVWANSPDYKQERMTRAHSDAPWGKDYAAHLTEPLPLRLVSARALVFIVMAPASIYRPTTNDTELVARWQRLVQFRTDAPARFGVPKGSPKRIDNTVPTTTSVRRTPHAKAKPSEDTTPMPIPSALLLSLPTAAELDEAVEAIANMPDAIPVAGTAATEVKVVEVASHPSLTDGFILDSYFTAIADLRARAEQLRGLLDLLPAQEVEERVAEFFRAGLNVLDKGRMA